MEAGDIERYLAELGAELRNRGLKKPVRILLIGGAYMLLLDRYILPEGQQKNAESIANALNQLFGREG